jgi:hypothetical protein
LKQTIQTVFNILTHKEKVKFCINTLLEFFIELLDIVFLGLLLVVMNFYSVNQIPANQILKLALFNKNSLGLIAVFLSLYVIFPKATFKGKIQSHVDITKEGTYPISVAGDLTVHGVTQKRTIPGTLSVKSGVISMTSEFIVKCADHHISIPQIVFHNIAESIKINVSATYTPYKSQAK